jgi:hypothetical protein
MATPEEIKKLLDQIDKAYQKLGDKNPFENFDTSNIKDAASTIKQLETALEGVNYRIGLSNSSAKDLSDQLKSIVQEVKNTNTPAKDFEKSLKRSITQAQKLKYEEEDISKLNKKQLEQIKEKIKQSKSDNIQNAERLINEVDLNNELIDQKRIAQEYLDDSEKAEDILIDKLNQRIAKEEKINKLMGLGGATIDGTQKALNKMGFGGLSSALGLDEVKEKMREIAGDIEGNPNSFSNKFKVLRGGIKEIGTQLKTSLKDPLIVTGFLIDQIFNALKKSDKATGDLAKAFNITYTDASNLREELIQMGNSSGDIAINARSLQESMVSVGNSLNSNAVLNEKDLITFTKLREQVGFTNEELAEMQKLTFVNGGNLEDNVANLLIAAKTTSLNNKVLLNEKTIMSEVAKTSKAIQLSLGGSGKELGNAVAQAKALGMNMQQLENIAGSLLNFESSIASELEAELLTGKDLNLERARMYAINNDLAGVAREINKQFGSTAEFGKMNRIQQEAAAKAIGMSREELAATLTDQEALKDISADQVGKAQEALNAARARGMTEEQIRKKTIDNLMSQQSIQERLNNTTEKLQEIFVNIAQPLMPLLDSLATVLELVGYILKPLEWMNTLFGNIGKNISKLIGPLETVGKVLKTLAGIAIIYAAYKAYASLAAAPLIGAAAGAAVSAGILISGFGVLNKIKDGVVDPKKGPVVSGEFGSVQLSEKDTAVFNGKEIIAGTNLGGKKSSSTTSSDMSRVEALLSQLVQKQDRPVQVSVEMDGEKVAKGVGNNSTKLSNSMSTNTFQVQ